MNYNITPPPYKHNEAYCLMYYEARHGKKMGFLVWNSRDGATPFVVMENGIEYQHSHWGMDKRLTNEEYLKRYILQPGQRIFRSITIQEAKAFTLKRLSQGKSTQFEIPEGSQYWSEMLETMTQDFYNGSQEPIMVTLQLNIKGEVEEKPVV